MKIKGTLSFVLLGVLSLSGCNPGGSVIYIKQCNEEHENHFMETSGQDFYDLVIFEDPDSGEPDDKLTTVLLIYSEDCSECTQAHQDLNYYANTNKVDMYKYNLTEHFNLGDDPSEEEINEVRTDYNYLYQAVAWLYDGPDYSDPVIQEWPSDVEDPTSLQFTTPNVIVFDNNTGATAVLPIGTTDYLKYFNDHFVIIDEGGNPIVSEDSSNS